MNINLPKGSNRLLLLLLSADFLFIVLHIIGPRTNYFDNPNFLLTTDGGYPEVFQYLKEYWIALLLLHFAIKKRNLLYLSLSILFGYFLVDDFFQIHETMGYKASIYFNFSPMLGLRAQDFGELIVSGFFGLCLFLLIGVTYYLAESNDKTTCRSILIMVLALVLFGVVVDMLGIMVKTYPWQPMLDIVEDGGEMLVMSVIFWFVFLLPEMEKN